MKKILSFGLLALATCALLSSCSSPKPTKTIENLKAAATGEANASAKYAAFAQKAADEGFLRVAVMFRATSAAEAKHRDNHLAELQKLGVTFEPKIDEIKVDSTLANLQTAIAGEEYEFTTMYPDFTKVANEEKALGAVMVFEWASKAEVRHAGFYSEAMNLIQANGTDEGLSEEWVVCQKCGDTYRLADLAKACELCGNVAEKFTHFKL